MEPWLDSLSEDWDSEHQSSSLSLPRGTPDPSLRSSRRSSHSQSRIPRMSPSNHSQGSTKANYLRPRSQKGLARSKESPILGEHSSSQLNVAAHQVEEQSKGTSKSNPKDLSRRSQSGKSSLPRKTSEAFSESLQSVQHHTIQDSAKRKNVGGTLEWKKRLANNGRLGEAGGDLFGPTKLEGIFQQPKTTFSRVESDALGSSESTRPWSLPLNSSDPPIEHAQGQPSMRASRSRVPEMEVLHEENEDEGNSMEFKNSGTSLAEQDEDNRIPYEDMPRRTEPTSVSRMAQSQDQGVSRQQNLSEITKRDPRSRTLSGMEEIRNELISPITISRSNTLNKHLRIGERHIALQQVKSGHFQETNSEIERPLSTSSDSLLYQRDDISLSGPDIKNEVFADLTSNSLPDDLSMGTQDFVARGGFVNTHRGGYSNENSFLRRSLSASSMPVKASSSSVPKHLQLRSSPPSSIVTFNKAYRGVSTPADRLTTPEPEDDQLSSTPSPTKSLPSPLKLFGNYDTFTNNRLLTRIGQFEDKQKDDSIHKENEDVLASDTPSSQTPRPSSNSQLLSQQLQDSFQPNQLRMSQFGRGDLDQYAFSQKVSRASSALQTQQEIRRSQEDRIFDYSPEGTPEGAFLGSKSRYKSASLPKVRKAGLEQVKRTTSTKISREEHSERIVMRVETHEQKRGLHSPGKERTPKRRRTLLNDEAVSLAAQEPTRDQNDPSRVAGRKRKDARYDNAEPIADPEVLATRQMLRPKPAQRRSSSQRTAHSSTNDELPPRDEVRDVHAQKIVDSGEDIISTVADELASAGADITRMANEARKGSVTTQDFLNEATKIMDLIRQKGKQKAALEILKEPENESESELATDDFADSTKEDFSRPPSREGHSPDRRMLQQPPQDPRVVSHLRKYAEEDDTAAILNSSMVSLKISDVEGRPSSPEPRKNFDVELQMSPANIRIRESIDQQRKRKHSPSTVDEGQSTRRNTQSSYGTSTGQSIPTTSSKSSGQKGVIMPGKVEIPNQLGPMVFDSSTKTWVKNAGHKNIGEGRRTRGTTSEEDPFEDIPDLSIDEVRENTQTVRFPSHHGKNHQLFTQAETVKDELRSGDQGSKSRREDSAQDKSFSVYPAPSQTKNLGSSLPVVASHTSSLTSSKNTTEPQNKPTRSLGPSQKLSEEAEHEIRVHEGRASKAPGNTDSNNKQPRVVTITFSSPLVSGVVYQDDRSVSDATSRTTDRPSLEDAAFLDESPETVTRLQEEAPQRQSGHRNISAPLVPRRRSGVEFVGRPVSRIDERDEEDEVADEMSLVHIGDTVDAMTPVPRRTEGSMIVPPIGGKGSSLLCLTPLSEFTLNQIDDPVHIELSYVAERTHPTSLQQAHGQLSLAVDDMVKAITDVEPYEPYWGQIRRLNLASKELITLHRLQDYCSDLEELDISDNSVGQLSGLPHSVRFLMAQRNSLTNLTSWGSLHNLQYLDISDNGLESLDAFSSLVHLRELKANRNRIWNIDGIFGLNGLLSLKLAGNELVSVNFEGAELFRLSQLDLSDNALTSVKGLQYLSNLEALDLENNKIDTFNLGPDVVLSKVRLLRLSNNALRALDVAPFPTLQLLYLDNNKITSLTSFSTAYSLQTLSLREQSDSPDILNLALSTTHDCRKLYLSCNVCPLGGLKRPPLPLLNLQYLEVASCGLSSLPVGFGAMLPNCRVLNLNFNALNSISPLQGILRLNKLLLAGNRIDRMRRTCEMLANFTALTKIDLRTNPLTIGFYPPSNTGEHRLVIRDPEKGQGERDLPDSFTLPEGDRTMDEKWTARLDPVTLTKRRMLNVLLAESCSQLLWVDGLDWSREENCKLDRVWMHLKERGVLKDGRHGHLCRVEAWVSRHEENERNSM